MIEDCYIWGSHRSNDWITSLFIKHSVIHNKQMRRKSYSQPVQVPPSTYGLKLQATTSLLTSSNACDAEIRSLGVNLINLWIKERKNFKPSSGTLLSKSCSNPVSGCPSKQIVSFARSVVSTMTEQGVSTSKRRHTFRQHDITRFPHLVPSRLPPRRQRA